MHIMEYRQMLVDDIINDFNDYRVQIPILLIEYMQMNQSVDGIDWDDIGSMLGFLIMQQWRGNLITGVRSKMQVMEGVE